MQDDRLEMGEEEEALASGSRSATGHCVYVSAEQLGAARRGCGAGCDGEKMHFSPSGYHCVLQDPVARPFALLFSSRDCNRLSEQSLLQRGGLDCSTLWLPLPLLAWLPGQGHGSQHEAPGALCSAGAAKEGERRDTRQNGANIEVQMEERVRKFTHNLEGKN